jgi:hypothetical protein
VSLINQQQRLVVLRETGGPRYLPIWIGPFEAEAITMGLHRTEVLRPMTHDLLYGLLMQLGAEIECIQVSELKDETFYARIVMTLGGERLEIDSRPSDAIALAVRARVPIFVSEDVMDRAGQVPAPEAADDEEDGEERTPDQLQVFRDFVEELDLDLGEDSEDRT